MIIGQLNGSGITYVVSVRIHDKIILTGERGNPSNPHVIERLPVGAQDLACTKVVVRALSGIVNVARGIEYRDRRAERGERRVCPSAAYWRSLPLSALTL